MNGQKPIRKEWKEVVEDLKVAIHNTEVQLELMRAQLKRAMEKSR